MEVDEEYMQFVMQFGFIVMFSSVFPLTSFVYFISNWINMQTMMNEFKYNRRFAPEMSIGIG